LSTPSVLPVGGRRNVCVSQALSIQSSHIWFFPLDFLVTGLCLPTDSQRHNDARFFQCHSQVGPVVRRCLPRLALAPSRIRRILSLEANRRRQPTDPVRARRRRARGAAGWLVGWLVGWLLWNRSSGTGGTRTWCRSHTQLSIASSCRFPSEPERPAFPGDDEAPGTARHSTAQHGRNRRRGPAGSSRTCRARRPPTCWGTRVRGR
jgi:hypothetical protein